MFVLKTTEHTPAPMVFGGTVVGALWMWVAVLMGDSYMIVSALVASHTIDSAPTCSAS